MLLFLSFVYVVHPAFKDHKDMNKHDNYLHSAKQSHHGHRRKHNQNSASSLSFDNNHYDTLYHTDNVVLKNSIQHYQEYVVSSSKSIKTKKSLHHYSDSDGESERLPVKPWSPTPNNLNGSSALQLSNNNDNQDLSPTSSPQLTFALRPLFEMITEDLDKFVYTPAPNGLGDIQCRITRDKRGMEKGLFPTYYMHVERPGDGKKVRINQKKKLNVISTIDLVFYSCWS